MTRPAGVEGAVPASERKQPQVVRITTLVSKPGMGADLVDRCRLIADRERGNHPDAYRVVQARRGLAGDRVEVVSITQWFDLRSMQELMPGDPGSHPVFWSEYAECVESWRVDVLEVTWTSEDGALA